jgi:hypothetical protein
MMTATPWCYRPMIGAEVTPKCQEAVLQAVEAQIESLLLFLTNVPIPHGMNQRVIANCQCRHQSFLGAPGLRSALRRFMKLSR